MTINILAPFTWPFLVLLVLGVVPFTAPMVVLAILLSQIRLDVSL